MDRLQKQYKDVKKSSKVKETKQCETPEQRARRYSPFKAFAVGGLLATSGMIGVESRQLQNPESRLLGQKNVTQPEFDPSRVPPGFTDYLRKIGTPESAVQDIQRRVLTEQRRKMAVGDPLQCLDVSASQVSGSSVSSLPDTGLPGVVEQLTYSLDVRNGCPLPADNVVYVTSQSDTCPPPANPATSVRKHTYDGDPTKVGINEHSGMLGPKSTFAGCQVLVNDVPTSMKLPDQLTVTVKAMGEVLGSKPGTVSIVSSPEITINVI